MKNYVFKKLEKEYHVSTKKTRVKTGRLPMVF